MNTTDRIYEAMYVVDSALNEQELESIVSRYSQLVTEQGGSVIAAGRWDKRQLAYEVKGKREGLYVLMVFEGAPAIAAELDRVFRISDEVIRFLITRVEREHIDVSRIGQPTSEEVSEEIEEAAEEALEEAGEEAVEAAVEETHIQESPAVPGEQVPEEPTVEQPAQVVEEPVAKEPAAEQAAPQEPSEAVEPAPEEESPEKTEDA